MYGFFSSCRYAPSLSSLILSREDDQFDKENPSGMMKILSPKDVAGAEYDECEQELALSFWEQGALLTIHVPFSPCNFTPELVRVLRLEVEEFA
jgi:hypothetical protein